MAKANFLRMLLTLFFLGGSVASIYNVYFDSTELRAQAAKVACGDQGCFRMLGEQRSPLKQVFTFQVQDQSAETRLINCSRAAFLVGAFDCSRAN